MGLCKCPKRKVTSLFCCVHKVNVCESCMVEQHPRCVVHSYMKWLEDSDFDPTCGLCSNTLEQGEVLRLVCYDLYHVDCLDKYASSIAKGVTVACPKCQDPIIPKANLVSPVADVVRRCISQFSWAASILPPLPVPAISTDPQHNSSLVLDEIDSAAGTTEFDHMMQRNQQSYPDHMIHFHQSQSDPVNRGHKPVEVLDEPDSPTVDSDENKKAFVPQKSTVTLKDVGGIDHCLQEIDNLVMHFKYPKLFEHLGVTPIKGFLLYGPPGCGKTLLVHAIAGELDIPFIEVAGTEIVKGVSGESENTLRQLFQQAKSNTPCILFLDDIDAICPKRETAQREMERRIVSQLLSCFNDLSNSPPDHHMLVIGATNHLDSLDSALRSAGRFEKEVSLGVPIEKARKGILEVLCKNLRLEEGFNHVTLAHATPGFVGGDLTLLVKEAAMIAIRRILEQQKQSIESSATPVLEGTLQQDSEGKEIVSEQVPSTVCIINEDFKQALTTVQPSAKREGFASIPDATWDDIGALDHIKEELALCILAPVHHPEHFESLGLTTPTGVLLIGPPGCGKTLLAKAVANESGINFILVKGPKLLNMYVGESEKAVRQVFQKARDSAPCVIFFDELDSICPRRSESREGHGSARVVNQLLTEMDGMQSRKQVFVMAATNCPDILDEAVLRPGRLDKTLYISLPTPDERIVILKTITKRKPCLAPDVDLDVIATDERCEGFSGADLNGLVKEAAIAALKETLPTVSLLQQRDSIIPVPLTDIAVQHRHFISAFSKIKPSVSKEDQTRYQKMAQQLSSNTC